jgi:hypothetical protein
MVLSVNPTATTTSAATSPSTGTLPESLVVTCSLGTVQMSTATIGLSTLGTVRFFVEQTKQPWNALG